MADKKIILYGSHPRKTSEEVSLAIVPVDPAPLTTVPLSKSYKQAYFVQVHRPMLPSSQEHRLLKDKPQQKKTIHMPKDVKLLPTKPNEKLVDVKTKKFGDVTCVKYTMTTP